MKKVLTLALAALALMSISGSVAFADHYDELVIMTMEENGSGQSGAVAFVAVDDDTTAVAINISGGSSEPQPAHIHKGTCANLDPKPEYPLSNVVNGTSETIVEVGIEELLSEDYAVNIHKSRTEASVYVSCGDIVAEAVVGMPRTGDSSQTLVLAGLALLAVGLTSSGVGLRVARRKA